MRTLHYGGKDRGIAMLCGAPWDVDSVTWRPYELASDAHRKHIYLADTRPCQACHRILNERGEFDSVYRENEERDIWRHLRIMALAGVDKEAAAVESAKWLLEAFGRSDLLSALERR